MRLLRIFRNILLLFCIGTVGGPAVVSYALQANSVEPLGVAVNDFQGAEKRSEERGGGATTQLGLDMVQVARQFPTHAGPTILYVNFDGWTHYDAKGNSILPMESPGVKRERDIQAILFMTGEIFAPFNVQVMRICGDGQFDRGSNGNTTVFVGGNTANINMEGRKYMEAVTPSASMDMPHSATSTWHRPNSNPHDLAFVDPMMQGPKDVSWRRGFNNETISRKIAHEAGHTFGLSHIITQGYPDLMSYDTNLRTYFADRTFPTTDLNYNARRGIKEHNTSLAPKWQGTPIATENTYQSLMALLGPRATDDRAHVADRRLVDPGYQQSTALELTNGIPLSGMIYPHGDYDVYRFRGILGQEVHVDVQPMPGGNLRPVVFVQDAAGQKFLRYAASSSVGAGCSADWQAKAGQSYLVVVGAVDGTSIGPYQVTVAGRSPPIAEAGPSSNSQTGSAN